MTDIEIHNKTDRDLLVIAVTTINAVGEKLDMFCARVEKQGTQLDILQAEHRGRTAEDCSLPRRTSKWGIGGVIAALITAILALAAALTRGG